MKRTRYVIPAAWFRLRPGKTMRFWLRVAKLVRRRKIPKRNIERVRQLLRGL